LEEDLKIILKKVIAIDVVIAILTSILSLEFFKPYTYVVIIGIVMAIINFILNAVTTNYLLSIGGNRFLIVFSSAVRIIVTIGIILLLYKNNNYNIIAFMVGYTLHYVAIILYGVTTTSKI